MLQKPKGPLGLEGQQEHSNTTPNPLHDKPNTDRHRRLGCCGILFQSRSWHELRRSKEHPEQQGELLPQLSQWVFEISSSQACHASVSPLAKGIMLQPFFLQEQEIHLSSEQPRHQALVLPVPGPGVSSSIVLPAPSSAGTSRKLAPQPVTPRPQRQTPGLSSLQRSRGWQQPPRCSRAQPPRLQRGAEPGPQLQGKRGSKHAPDLHPSGLSPALRKRHPAGKEAQGGERGCWEGESPHETPPSSAPPPAAASPLVSPQSPGRLRRLSHDGQRLTPTPAPLKTPFWHPGEGAEAPSSGRDSELLRSCVPQFPYRLLALPWSAGLLRAQSSVSPHPSTTPSACPSKRPPHSFPTSSNSQEVRRVSAASYSPHPSPPLLRRGQP